MSNNFGLKEFLSWAVEVGNSMFPANKLIICKPSDNSAAYIEIDTKQVVSRITFWESGTVFMEGISVSDIDKNYHFDGFARSKDEMNELAKYHLEEILNGNWR